MFKNRWIRIPILAGAWWLIWQLAFNAVTPYPIGIWRVIIGGLIFGFVLEGFAWIRVRGRYGNVGPEALEPHQEHILVLMQDKRRAFENCQRALESLPNLKGLLLEPEADLIRVRSKINWNSSGSKFTISLREIAEHLTEVTIKAQPRLRTVLIDSGYAWTTTNQIVSEIKKLDSRLSDNTLRDGAEMLHDLTARPIKSCS